MKLSIWRRIHDLTLVELAKRIGVTEVSLSRYERGERIPAREIMPKIVKATDGAVQPNDFYSNGKDEGGPRQPEPVEAA